MDVEGARTLAVTLAAVGQVLFIGFYSTRRWWTHPVGRALWVKSASLALVLFLNALYRLVPDLPYEMEVKAVSFWLIVPGIWWQFIALLRQGWLAHEPQTAGETL